MIGAACAALPVLSILGFALTLHRALQLPVALTLLPAIAVAVLALLAGGLVGVLHAAWLATLLIGLILLAWPGLRTLHAGAWKEAALWGFLAVAVGLYAYMVPLRLIFWDEFSHWGTLPKYMLLTDRLPSLLGEVIFFEYPPGLGLFSYFVTRGFGFDEGLLLFASALMQTAALLSFVGGLGWRDLPSGAVLAAALVIVGSIFGISGYSWTTVTADNTLAYVAAAAFLIYFAGGCTSGALVASSLVLALTCTIKDSGNLLAAVVGLAILVHQLLRRRFRLGAMRLLRIVVVLALPSAVAILAWRTHVAALHQQISYPVDLPYIQARLASPGFSDYALPLMHKYGAALLGARPIGNPRLGVPVWVAGLLLLALNAVLLQWRHGRAGAAAMLQTVLFLGLLVYLASLLFYVVFAFLPYEARILAGFERYTGTYLLMWLLCGLGALIWSGTDLPSRLCLAGWAAIVVVMAGPAFWANATLGPRGDAFARDVLRARDQVTAALGGSLLVKVPSNASVYVLWNGITGQQYYISQFELKPRSTSFPIFRLHVPERFTDPHQWCHSLGPPRFPDDVWSCDWSLQTFVTALNGYDFLFVGAADEAFIARYGSLFSAGSLQAGKTMFRIVRDGETLQMEPVRP